MFSRTKLLIGEEAFSKLASSTVLIFGVGGVGSVAAESLARSGIKKLVLVDNDIINISNLNRQIQTEFSNVGKSKVREMKKRLISINPNIEIVTYDIFYTKEHNYVFENVDFVIDAIDSISSKVDLIEYCLENKIGFISSLGMGNRFDPSKVFKTTLDKTSYDPLAKILRRKARDRHFNLKKINVVYSSEIPIKQNEVIYENDMEVMPPASMFLVPPAAGLNCASFCINYLINKE